MMAQRTRKPSCSQPPDEAHGRLAQAFIGSLASIRSICVFENGTASWSLHGEEMEYVALSLAG